MMRSLATLVLALSAIVPPLAEEARADQMIG